MSDEVKSTRYHRRRRRTRKKKSAVTIESLHPGRAPLGYQPSPSLPASLHHDVPIVTASSSECPGKENFFQPSSPYFQSSPRSLSSAAAQREEEPFPRDSPSAPQISEDQTEPVTMRRNFYLMRHDQSDTPSASSTSMAQEALEDIGELASSRPISLSQLYTKANSRTKSGRAVKAFMAEMAAESKPEVLPLATSFREAGQDTYSSQSSVVRRTSNGEYVLDPRSDDPVPSRIFSQEPGYDSAERLGGQNWQRAEGHQQQNPLNFSDDLGAYYLSRSQERSCVSESPFLKNGGYQLSEQDAWPAEAHTIPGGASLGAQQSRLSSRDLVSRSEYSPESSLLLYRASFDRPEDQSPYGSVRLRHSASETAGSYEIPSAENPPQERHKEYAIIRSGTMLTAVSQEEPNADKYACSTEFRPQISTSRTQPPTRALPSIASGTGLAGASTLGLSTQNRANEEATRFLDKIAPNPASHVKQATLPDPFVEPNESSACNASASRDHSEELALLTTKLGEYANESHRQLPTDPRSHPEQGTLRSLCESTVTDVPPPRKISPIEDSRAKSKENCAQVHAEPQTRATDKILRPPPGLPKPAASQMIAGEFLYTENPIRAKARADEADAWFHKDPRGEELLRQQVAVIAQNHAERIERLTGTDGTTAMQMNLLLGNVIVNLHSHFSECKQRHSEIPALEEGATFERATSSARRRSYFDRDPSVSYWRFPLGHVSSDEGRHSDRTATYLSPDHKL